MTGIPQHVAALAAMLAANTELTTKEMLLVCMVANHPMPIGDAADALGTANSYMSRMVERLVKMDLIARVENPEDRRQKLITATKTGRALDRRAKMHFEAARP